MLNINKNKLIFIALVRYPEIMDTGMTKYQLNYFSKKFDHIYVFCQGNSGVSVHDNVIFFHGNIILWLKYYLKIKKKNISFVYITDWFVGGIIGVLFSKWSKCDLVLRCGSPWKYDIKNVFEFIKSNLAEVTKYLVLKNCKRVVYNSKSLILEQVKHDYTVVYNGVDTTLFKPMKINKESTKLDVLFIGRICKEKGLNYLLEAVNELKTEVHLGIVGEGDLKQSYSDSYPFVKFYGRILHRQLPTIINSYDVVILPSLKNSSESFPSALIEGMSCGKPVIATKVWGIPEMVIDGKTGILVPEKSKYEIKKALQTLIDNPELRLSMGKNARISVKERFELEECIPLLYRSLFLEKQ